MCRACNGRPEDGDTRRSPADAKSSAERVVSRRRALVGGSAVAAASVLRWEDIAAAAAERRGRYGAYPQPDIHPRSDWAGDDFPVRGPIEAENPTFLIVHHTETTNDYSVEGTTEEIRDIYRFHTGAEKGWPDIAYNFFVDRYGGIWEARSGSLAGPVRGSATGGNQGFTQLVCVIGSFKTEEPPQAAITSLVSVLAWLGDRYSIDTNPGASVTFTSLGSNKHAAGSTVTTSTIAGHREMSETDCPGDAFFPIVKDQLPGAVTSARGDVVTPPVPTDQAPEAPTTIAPPTSSTTSEPADVSLTTTDPKIATIGSTTIEGDDLGTDSVKNPGWPLWAGGALGLLGVAAGATALVALRGRTAVKSHRTVTPSHWVDGAFAEWWEPPGFGLVALNVDIADLNRLRDALASRLDNIAKGEPDKSGEIKASALQSMVAKVETARGPRIDLGIVVRQPGRLTWALSRYATFSHADLGGSTVIRVGNGGSLRFSAGAEPQWDAIVRGRPVVAASGPYSEFRTELIDGAGAGALLSAS